MLRRFLAFIIAAFAGAAFCLWIISFSSTFQSCVRQEGHYQSTQNSEGKQQSVIFTSNLRCLVRFTDGHNGIITAIATVLLTFVTGGLVWTGYLQVRTVRVQLRAYVFADSVGLFDGMMLNPQQPQRTNEPGIVLTWKNTGQTPASNVVTWGQVAVIEPINESQLVVPDLQNIFASHLGAGMIGTKALWFGRPLTPNELADVKAAARAIYVYGRIEYRDIFGKFHFSNFRLAYAGAFPAPGVTFSVCQQGNEAQ